MEELYWFFIVFLSIVGMGFYWSGQRSGNAWFIISGIVMMVYPYFISNTFLLIGIGLVLTAAPFYMSYKS